MFKPLAFKETIFRFRNGERGERVSILILKGEMRGEVREEGGGLGEEGEESERDRSKKKEGERFLFRESGGESNYGRKSCFLLLWEWEKLLLSAQDLSCLE